MATDGTLEQACKTSERALLENGLAEMGLHLGQSARENLLRYVALLAKWNKVYNLTAVREPERMIGLHILDSLSVLSQMKGYKNILDVGTGGGLPGLLTRPVPGPVGSPFGMRLHPIFHEWRLHNGVDLSAGCGTPIRAAADGRVSSVTYDAASGHRLEIDHGRVGGRRLVTLYLHALGYSVRPGAEVHRGQPVGRVGSTGWSTACHLHFTVKVDGSYADPERFL